MSEHGVAWSVASDSRPRCILCETLLPVLPAETRESRNPVCARCWELTPDDRRMLRNRAMTRVLRRDLTS